MKITKSVLKQLIKEELAATLNERRSRMSDLVAVDQAETAAHADIDAEYSYAPEVAERMKALYTDGRKFAVYPDAGRSDPGAAAAHRRRLKKGTTAARRYYKKGISDAKRILGAQQTPFEYEGYRAPGESEAAEGPYYSLAQASERSDAQLAAAKQSKDAQAKDPSGAYQALGDAAMRGSGMAISRLMDAAETDPAAQAILDTVEEAEREAKRKTPLSADLEADMLEELINEELGNVIEEMRLSQGARYIDEYGMEEDFMGESPMDEGYLEEDFFSEGYLEEEEGESLESRVKRLEDAMLG